VVVRLSSDSKSGYVPSYGPQEMGFGCHGWKIGGMVTMCLVAL
jgi:hypothetical protein